MENDLLTNKSAAALLRDSELEIALRKEPPVDLRTVPLGEWDQYLERDVVIPDELAKFLEPVGAPMSTDVVHGIEIAMERLHGVKPPFYIYMSVALQELGRPWKYVKEAAPYLTGLILGKRP